MFIGGPMKVTYKRFFSRLSALLFAFFISSHVVTATIWLEKKEIESFLSDLGLDSKQEIRSLLQIRMQKLQKIHGNFQKNATLFNKKYGFFLNLRDICEFLLITSDRNIEHKVLHEALVKCLQNFRQRLNDKDYRFTCEIAYDDSAICNILETIISPYQMARYTINRLTSIFILFDIIFTPVKQKHGSTHPIDAMYKNYDLTDRSLLYNFVPKDTDQLVRTDEFYSNDNIPHLFQFSVLEINKLKELLVQHQDDQVFCSEIAATIQRLLTESMHIQEAVTGIALEEFKAQKSDKKLKEYPIRLWCNCEHVTMSERIAGAATIIAHVVKNIAPETKITHIAFGSGYFLQDFLVVSRLLELGYTVDVHLIDALYREGHKEYRRVLGSIDTLMSHVCDEKLESEKNDSFIKLLYRKNDTPCPVFLYDSVDSFLSNAPTKVDPAGIKIATNIDTSYRKDWTNDSFCKLLANTKGSPAFSHTKFFDLNHNQLQVS